MRLPPKRLSQKKRSPALVPAEGQDSFNAAVLASLSNSIQLKLDERGNGKRAFFEDFTLEHSRSGAKVAPIVLAGFF